MGHNDHINYELYDRIQHFVDAGSLEAGTKEHGIALFVADNGVFALSDKQRYVWDTAIAPILAKPMNEQERSDEARDQDRENEMRDLYGS